MLKKKIAILESNTDSERLSLQVLEKQQEMLGIFMEAPVSVVITREAELKLDFINKAAMNQMGKLDEILGVLQLLNILLNLSHHLMRIS